MAFRYFFKSLIQAHATISASVKLFGSHATSLAIPSSDLDLVVVGAEDLSRCSPIITLANGIISTVGFQLVFVALRRKNWVKDLQVIETAKVPLIKLTSTVRDIPSFLDKGARKTFPRTLPLMDMVLLQ